MEQSISRMDPAAAYGYNALGIAYLEQGQFGKAMPAFHDAENRAQHWSYPLHNEALAYTEMGDFTAAVRAYQQAMRLTPQYSYLPYNLGLVYQRMNRRKDAESAYRKAMMLAPDSAEPYNALGTLMASEGKARTPKACTATPCSAIPGCYRRGTIWRCCWSKEKNRQGEALDLWRERSAAIAGLSALASQPGRGPFD